MKSGFVLLLLLFIFSCDDERLQRSVDPINWEKRTINSPLGDSLINGSTYLSIYSHIYSQSESTTHDLTATVSMRNTNQSDTIFIDNARYFDTKGTLIRTYFDKTIFLAPMETFEIVIDQVDAAGGSGANFMFDWQAPAGSMEPFFEGVMISTYGAQGLSFTTQGRRIK